MKTTNEIVKEGKVTDTNTLYETSKKGEHYSYRLEIGRLFPTTKTQAKAFVKGEYGLDMLGIGDVEKIEALLQKHGFQGKFKYTKSKRWVWLLNINDFRTALKKEYL